MYTIFIIDFVSFLLLGAAFYLLWRERARFYSLKPLLPAIVFLSVGHACDMLLEHPNLQAEAIIGLSRGSLEQLFATISNITDVVGIAFLIYGFISIIKHERVEEKHIQDLERMLPLCASCKKYRTEDGKWMPIENYLLGLGGARLTHGICPECTTKLYGDILDRKSG